MGYFDSRLKPARLAGAVAVAGLVIGFAAWLLKWLIGTMKHVALSPLDGKADAGWWLLLLPIVGFMVVGWLVRNVIRYPLENGVLQLKRHVDASDGKLPNRLSISSIVTCAITLGCGGSAGAESPIAYAGAGISSNVARYFGMAQRDMLIFMACGGGAGIAAIFKSPVGGIFFTLEVLRMQLGIVPVLVLAAMCVISGLTAYAIDGFTPDVSFYTAPTFEWSMILPVVVTGLVTGLYSLYYRAGGSWTVGRLKLLRRPVVANFVSGLTMGVFLLLFPALYGEGYGVLSSLAEGHTGAVTDGTLFGLIHGHLLLPIALACILLAKPLVCYVTNEGGGVAGDFTPTFFAGGIAGALLSLLWPHAGITPDLFMICGMAGAMAGIMRAPLMTIFLATEMTGMPYTLLPVTLTVAISYGLSRFLSPGQ
ncbi:MAG: chloride channel protein [Muribaculaceae bacterium]|nr:chloride channel protein [Muribaculaceae bacterium]